MIGDPSAARTRGEAIVGPGGEGEIWLPHRTPPGLHFHASRRWRWCRESEIRTHSGRVCKRLTGGDHAHPSPILHTNLRLTTLAVCDQLRHPARPIRATRDRPVIGARQQTAAAHDGAVGLDVRVDPEVDIAADDPHAVKPTAARNARNPLIVEAPGAQAANHRRAENRRRRGRDAADRAAVCRRRHRVRSAAPRSCQQDRASCNTRRDDRRQRPAATSAYPRNPLPHRRDITLSTVHSRPNFMTAALGLEAVG